MAIVPPEKGGRTAVTHWETWERLGNYSLIHFRLETGRTHQIRVHAQSMGWPILGDPVYGLAGPTATSRLHLHARAICLPIQDNKAPIIAQAPPPEHMLEALTLCGYNQLLMARETPNISHSE